MYATRRPSGSGVDGGVEGEPARDAPGDIDEPDVNVSLHRTIDRHALPIGREVRIGRRRVVGRRKRAEHVTGAVNRDELPSSGATRPVRESAA